MKNNLGTHATRRNRHVIWVCPDTRDFFRAKDGIECRAASVLPKLADKGFGLNILLPFDQRILPKTKLAQQHITHHKIHLSKDYGVDILKLTTGTTVPGIYMAKIPPLDPGIFFAVFAKTALAFARQLRLRVDIFHLFDWETALLPLFLELEKNSSPLFRNTRTILNVHSLKDQGNFPPETLPALGLPAELLQPEGIEFYGKVSYLKSGLLFSDKIRLIDKPHEMPHQNGAPDGLEGVLNTITGKILQWPSERSVQSHLEDYEELLEMPRAKSVLPRLLERLKATATGPSNFVEMWGPVPPERYGINTISFMLQAPRKAYVFWEWHESGRDLGVLFEESPSGKRHLLSKGLSAVGEYWINTIPAQGYIVELVGWTSSGKMETLLRSKLLRTSRETPSPNREALFIDVRSKRRFHGDRVHTDRIHDWRGLLFRTGGGSAAFEWSLPSEESSLVTTPFSLPSSLPSSGASDLLQKAANNTPARLKKKNPPHR